MFDQILELVKQQGQQSVVENADVPNDQNNAVMAETANTITGGLQNVLSGGGLQNVISMFTGGEQSQNGGAGLMSNPMVSMMIGHLTNNLVKKTNLNPAAANGVASNIIPSVLNNLISNTRSNEPAHSGFNLNNLIGSLTGGAPGQDGATSGGFDFQGLIGKLGADTNGDGKVDLGDIVNTVTRQAQGQQQSQNQGGGLTSLIQGLFK